MSDCTVVLSSFEIADLAHHDRAALLDELIRFALGIGLRGLCFGFGFGDETGRRGAGVAQGLLCGGVRVVDRGVGSALGHEEDLGRLVGVGLRIG